MAAIPESAALRRRVEAIVFDWDGTVAWDHHADTTRLRRLVHAASIHGLDLAIVSGTQIGNVDGQLRARPRGPGALIMALNRGSEVFAVGRDGPQLLSRRVATTGEKAALTRAAQLTVDRLAARGIKAQIVSTRPNRRRIDLIPEPEWIDPPEARIAELLAAVEHRLALAGFAGLSEAVALAEVAAIDAGLADPRITSDAKHIELGLTDKSDSARWIMQWLWGRGIAPEQALVVGGELGPLGGLPGSDSLLLMGDASRLTAASAGAEPGGVPPGVVALGGGPETLAALLADQIQRRADGELPIHPNIKDWSVTIESADPAYERVYESLLTLADGRLGTRGSALVRIAGSRPVVLMSGTYTRAGHETHLLTAPRWNQITADNTAASSVRRVLDLRTGALHQRVEHATGGFDALLFSSLRRPGTAVLRATGTLPNTGCARILEPPPQLRTETGADGGLSWMRVTGHPGSIAAAAHEYRRRSEVGDVLDRIASYQATPAGVTDHRSVLARVRRARDDGFDTLWARHRQAWASRWEAADIQLQGDPDLQLAIRFALFHLIASVGSKGEAAVGARGLSGTAYHGHVFWDSDVFVLPFLAATWPLAARAMLEYRVRRLPAALRTARALGARGARFPWESARSGQDVTPHSAVDHDGEPIPILTGQLEEHIVADVAWSAACYIDWTGDQAFATGPGLELLVQTARWWASRIQRDEAGRGHLRNVIGPDEYHESVDDNAYTNVMARWNLRRAAAAAAEAVPDREVHLWLELADSLVDRYDAATGIYEQFDGFHALEPLLIVELAPRRPVAADVLLGHDRVRGAQVVKQADVLMLHYLVPDEVAAGSLEPNLDFYDPRTAHGSTLSSGVHAALLARAGRLQQAIEALKLTARIDLDDTGHLTAGGLHVAAMGSIWRALVFGFAGIRPEHDSIVVNPVLPQEWQTLDVRLRFRDSRIRARIHGGAVELTASPPVNAIAPTGEPIELTATARTFNLAPSTARSVR